MATATTKKVSPAKETTMLVNAAPVKPETLPDISNVLAIALAKSLSSEGFIDGLINHRDTIKVGDHPFKGQFTVSLDGVLRKGEDFTQKISNKIDWMLAFAVVASMLNETSMKHAMRLINVAHRSKKNHPEKTQELMDRVKSNVEAKIAWLKKSTERSMDGKVTFPTRNVKIKEVTNG